MRHILEGLKRNVRGHAETCLLIIFSSRGCVVFSPIFLSNFLGGCPNHEKIKKHMHIWMISRGVAEQAWADLSWCRMMGKGKVSEDRTAKCSQKQTGSQDNDTFMQNEKTKKKQENQENQEDLLGQSASDIGLFLLLVFVCSFACPKAKMQRVESCHLLVFLSANAYVKTENVQRGMQKAHSGDPLFC